MSVTNAKTAEARDYGNLVYEAVKSAVADWGDDFGVAVDATDYEDCDSFEVDVSHATLQAVHFFRCRIGSEQEVQIENGEDWWETFDKAELFALMWFDLATHAAIRRVVKAGKKS